MTARLERTGEAAGVVAGRPRAATAQEFVTDLQVAGENMFAVGARWPEQHSYFGPARHGGHDPMQFAETVRQAALAIAQRAFNAPLDAGFLPYQVLWTVDREGLAATGAPVDLVLTATAHDLRHEGGQLDSMRLEFDCYRDGYRIGSAVEGWSSMSAAGYRRVRGANLGAEPYRATLLPAVEPELVGRAEAADVVVAESSLYNIWALQFELDHPVLLGNPADHVPNMLLLEAARQVALRIVEDATAVPVQAEFTFNRCVEFDESCLIVADADPPIDDVRMINLSFEQNGLVAASGTVSVQLP